LTASFEERNRDWRGTGRIGVKSKHRKGTKLFVERGKNWWSSNTEYQYGEKNSLGIKKWLNTRGTVGGNLKGQKRRGKMFPSKRTRSLAGPDGAKTGRKEKKKIRTE